MARLLFHYKDAIGSCVFAEAFGIVGSVGSRMLIPVHQYCSRRDLFGRPTTESAVIPDVLYRLAAHRRYILPSVRRIGYLGWLGHGNLGDEAMYLAIRAYMRPFRLVHYRNGPRIRIIQSLHGRNRPLYVGVLLGGGTLINSVGWLKPFETALNNYSPVAVLGTGARNPLFWKEDGIPGPVREKWIELLLRCRFVGVRGPLSVQILRDGGLTNVVELGDPALLLAPETFVGKTGTKRIGINAGRAKGNVWGDEEMIHEKLIEVCRILRARGWHISLVSVTPSDTPYLESISRRVDGARPLEMSFVSMNECLRVLEQFDVFIGEKLHSVVMALSAGTPSVMLEYRPKCLDFMMSMGLEKYSVRTDEIDCDKLSALVDELAEEGTTIQETVRNRIVEVKNRYDASREVVAQLFDGDKR